MLQWKSNRAAFTLIELLVVVIIVAVLAAVGLPLLSGNVERARVSEADAGLSSIRTELRAELAETGSYPTMAVTDPITDLEGIVAADLTGRFFEDDDYSVLASAAAYCIGVAGDTAGAAPRGTDVNGVTRSMDENGDIFSSGDCSGTAVN